MKFVLRVAGIVVIVCILLIIGLYVFTRQSIAVSAVGVRSVEVTPQVIVLKNVSQSNSGMWYAGYRATYADGVLTVILYAHGPIRFPSDQDDAFSVEIPNSYGDVRQVRIGGGSEGATKIVWER